MRNVMIIFHVVIMGIKAKTPVLHQALKHDSLKRIADQVANVVVLKAWDLLEANLDESTLSKIQRLTMKRQVMRPDTSNKRLLFPVGCRESSLPMRHSVFPVSYCTSPFSHSHPGRMSLVSQAQPALNSDKARHAMDGAERSAMEYHFLPRARALAAKPVVGIYPTSPAYLRAYQQWVEQFGAVTFILPKSGSVDYYFPKLNALLIPGGSGDVDPFARALINRAIQANGQGDYFPVWGTCLGFEWIIQVVSGNDRVLQDGFDGIDDPENLIFNPKAFPGRLFQSANESLQSWFVSQKVTYNAHVLGIEPRHFAKNSDLVATFDILAYSLDKRKRMFVAVIEGKNLPIYGVQFHPEKVRYSPNFFQFSLFPPKIPASPEAEAASDHLAKFLVSEAKKNTHRSPFAFQNDPMRRRRNP
eukprot:gnl/MRDRNA2_/MRDRNA2_173330_c0_seq1.p1 gnl/MRDRNA2_/MRDRNA2_173330_c0~~gnl/MRDRNA2_/MRDRNA2_173330_c0_seq1.p1  ORF type:complete len:416 (-),score=46.25 gnl/MRDRNA2_/MRDRNA2_173330_c0_seq1:308-1555(-)